MASDVLIELHYVYDNFTHGRSAPRGHWQVGIDIEPAQEVFDGPERVS